MPFPYYSMGLCIIICIANGQLNRKIKVVREPKSYKDKVIPWENNLFDKKTINKIKEVKF